MNVLHVISSLQEAAGTTVFCVEICKHLRALGVEVTIATPPSCGDGVMLPSSDVSVIRTNDLSTLSPRPDLIHIHALWNNLPHQACMYARKHAIPFIISPHGMLTQWALNHSKWKKRLALALYQMRDLRNAAMLHATADSEVDDIRRLGLKQPVFVAPLGVSVSPEPSIIKHNKKKVALFVSRVHPKKGLINLVDAWALLKKQESSICNWRCVIAGPDQNGHAAEVMGRAKECGVENDFEILGPVFGAQKSKLYLTADVFVLPTYSENFGVVVIEALAHGCPVITTKGTPWAELLGYQERVNSKPLIVNSEPCRELADNQLLTVYGSQLTDFTANDRCGWWIDIGVNPLAAALLEAMSLTDQERFTLGLNGRRMVEAKYTWLSVAKKTKSAYEKALIKC